MTSRVRLFVLLFAIAGVGVSGAATWVHHKLLTDASYVSPCDVNEVFNCSQVYLSPYGSIKGVPVAIGGVIWFGLVALVAGFADTTGDPKRQAAGAYVFALGTIGLAVVLSLAYTSFFVLKNACILCMATYACVLGVFITSGMASSVPVMSLPGRLFADLRDALARPVRLTATVVYAGAIAALILFVPVTGNAAPAMSSAPPPKLDGAAATPAQDQDPKVQFEAWWNAQPRVETGVPLNGAKVVIVKFSDFMCPGCKQTWMMYSPILKKYADSQPNDVRYVMKDFPLNSECNVSVQTGMHPFSCDASVAYRGAVARGKGPEMEKWLFDNQAALTTASIQNAARDIAGITDFALETAQRITAIKKDTADGGALGINQTPTFYINGVKLPTQQWLNPEYFDYAIQLELKRAAQPAAGKGAK